MSDTKLSVNDAKLLRNNGLEELGKVWEDKVWKHRSIVVIRIPERKELEWNTKIMRRRNEPIRTHIVLNMIIKEPNKVGLSNLKNHCCCVVLIGLLIRYKKRKKKNESSTNLKKVYWSPCRPRKFRLPTLERASLPLSKLLTRRSLIHCGLTM